MRASSLGFVLLASILGAQPGIASTTEIDGFHPSSGASGDLVYLQGRGLGPDARVLIGGRPADVMRATEETLVCRVPEGLDEGEAAVSVGAQASSERFFVLAKGRPVIHLSSARTATAGQWLLLHGRRLGGGKAEFLDGLGLVAASSDVVGRSRSVAVRVPPELLPGRYRLRLTNAEGLFTLPSSPYLEVCAPGPRVVFTVRGASVRPGERITYTGRNLGPLGSCDVRWTQCDDSVCSASGWSNGCDRVTVVAPHSLSANRWHQVRFAPPGGTAGGFSRVFALPAEVPERLELDGTTAVAGGTLGIQGMPASGLGGWPHVVLTRGEEEVAARTLYLHPGGLGHGRSWILRLPASLEAGVWQVSVRVNGAAVDAGSVRVIQHAVPGRPVSKGHE